MGLVAGRALPTPPTAYPSNTSLPPTLGLFFAAPALASLALFAVARVLEGPVLSVDTAYMYASPCTYTAMCARMVVVLMVVVVEC